MFWGTILTKNSSFRFVQGKTQRICITNIAIPYSIKSSTLFIKINKNTFQIARLDVNNPHKQVQIILLLQDEPELFVKEGQLHLVGNFQPTLLQINSEDEDNSEPSLTNSSNSNDSA